jgi:hypothetical protein
LLFFLIFACSPSHLTGQTADSIQHYLALDLTQEQGLSLSTQDLETAASAGINLLLVNADLQMPEGNLDGISFILFSGNRFSTVQQIRTQSPDIIFNLRRDIESIEQNYPGKIAAIELFRNPNDRDVRFVNISQSIIDSVRIITDLPLFYTSATLQIQPNSGPFDFIAVETGRDQIESHEFSPFVRFKPSGDLRSSLIALERLLHIQSLPENSAIVLPYSWFRNAMDTIPGLATVLSMYTAGERIPIPLPAEGKTVPAANWSVLILILIWISFVLHFRFQPVYGQSFTRYFFHHQFYIADVIEQRVRNATPGLIVLFQHSVITALFIYVSASILITETGFAALRAQFPQLFLVQNPLLSLSVAGFTAALLLKAISVLWIYLLNKELTNFSQILNLYSWPIHLNLLTVTLLVVMSQGGITGFRIALLGILFALTWFMCFNMAAMDAARFLKSRVIYLVLTVGIHVLLVMFVIWYIINSPLIYEPLQMAFSFGHFAS